VALFNLAQPLHVQQTRLGFCHDEKYLGRQKCFSVILPVEFLQGKMFSRSTDSEKNIPNSSTIEIQLYHVPQRATWCIWADEEQMTRYSQWVTLHQCSRTFPNDASQVLTGRNYANRTYTWKNLEQNNVKFISVSWKGIHKQRATDQQNGASASRGVPV